MTPRDGDLIQVGNTTFSFRDPESTKADLSIPDLVIDSKEGFVRVNRKIVFLSPKENSLLVFLYNHRPDYCSKIQSGNLFGQSINLRMFLTIKLRIW